MGFWIFMLITDLLIPTTMMVFGKLFMKKAPDSINPVFGYRTAMSIRKLGNLLINIAAGCGGFGESLWLLPPWSYFCFFWGAIRM